MWRLIGRQPLSNFSALLILIFPLAVSGSRQVLAVNPQYSSSLFSIRPGTTHEYPSLVHAVRVRGGADASDDNEVEEESDDEYDDEDGAFDALEMGEAGDDEFTEDTSVDRWLTLFQKTPPLTKGYLTASFVVTVGSFMLNNNQFPKLLSLDWRKVLQGQLWRPFTTFLNFGPFGISYGLTLQFVWMYMSTLERLHHRKPYDFWLMILFGMVTMVVGYPVLRVNPRFLGHNLSTFLVYMWSRYNEGNLVKIFDLYTTKAEMLPWFFMAQTFLLEGEPPLLDVLGIVFGHIYYHMNSAGSLRAPQFVVDWYKNSDSELASKIRQKYKEISSDFEVV